MTEPDGYRLAADPMRVDALRFLRILDSAAEQSDAKRERDMLAEGLQLRGGTAGGRRFPGTDRGLGATADRAVPLFAAERRIDLDGGIVADSELAAELTDLVAQHPLRESLWERLIRVLARSGRRAEALLLSADVEQPAVAREQLPRKLPFDVASFTGRDA